MTLPSAPTVPSSANPRRTRLFLAAVVAIALFAVLPSSASAVTKTWDGSASADWSEPNNWTPGIAAPTSSDDVVIDSTSNASPNPNPVVSGTCAACTAQTVTLSGSRTLTISDGLLDVTLGSGADSISAPTGTNVTLSGGKLKFGTLTVDNASGLTMTGGTIAGTLAATAPTELVNAGTDYDSTLGNVTLGTNVNLRQTGEVSLLGTAILSINSRTYTVENSSLTTDAASSINVTSGTLALAGAVGGGRIVGGAATINIGSGTLNNSGPGTVGGLVEPKVKVTGGGTLSDSSSASTGLILNNPTGVTNELQGSLTTSGSGRITLTSGAAPNTYQLTGPLTVNQGGGAITIGGVGTIFDLENASNVAQTVTLNGTLTWDAAPANFMKGSGTFTGPCPTIPASTCRLLIHGGAGTFEAGKTVTVTSGETVEVDTGNLDLPDNFVFTMNGTLQLTGASDLTTASAAANTPKINLSSTGTLLHNGSGVSTVEAEVNSTGGTIEDNSTAGGGELQINNDSAVVVNDLSGTIKTDNASSDVELGTGVFRLNGALTFDTTLGGRIATTTAGTDLQLNNQTLTLLGSNALEHEAGSITSNTPNSTIGGTGTLKLEGGNIATGVRLTINTPVSQTSAVDLSGAGARLDIGGTWTSSNNITDSSTGGLITVLAAGVLQHSTGAGAIDPDLQINGKAELLSGASTDWFFNGTTTVGSGGTINVAASSPRLLDVNSLTNLSGTTLTGGTYSVTGSGSLILPGPVNTLNANVSLAGAGALLEDDGTTGPALDNLATIGAGGKLTLVGGHSEAPAATLALIGGGTLAGVGTIVANVTNGTGTADSGVVSPGNDTGTLTVTGNYVQNAGGRLDINVNGTAAGQFDVLSSLGDATLDGAVALLPSTAYAAAAQTGDFQPFLAYDGTRTGTFATITVDPPLAGGKPYTIEYNDAGKRVLAVVGQEADDDDGGGGGGGGGGVPDSDGDGVPDSSDSCPSTAGPASNAGCPVAVTLADSDGDGDGVLASVDQCPTLAGKAVNNGCPKVRPRRLTERVRPTSDSSAPYKYTVSGRLVLPVGLARASSVGSQISLATLCTGKVRITVKRGGRTVARRTARLKSNCRYKKRLRFSARRLPGSGKLRIKSRFRGNNALKSRSSKTSKVTFG